jgi:hypothetical protein
MSIPWGGFEETSSPLLGFDDLAVRALFGVSCFKSEPALLLGRTFLPLFFSLLLLHSRLFSGLSFFGFLGVLGLWGVHGWWGAFFTLLYFLCK